MNSIYKKNKSFGILMLFGAFLLSSCGSRQNVTYFSDLDSNNIKQVQMAKFKEPVIQTDDILSITVQTLDATSTTSMNQTSTGTSGSSSSPAEATTTAVSGFLVDKEGNVEIPILGKVKVSGLTTSEAKEVVRTRASKYYKEPTVQLRFANYKITVLGEVTKPASYNLPYEKVTVLDAISMAGDLTIYGKRNNILLLRDNDGKKDVVRLDLNSSTILSSPYFYLQQNDVIYVEPSKAKAAANNAARNTLITIGVSVATLLVTILARFN